MIAEILGTFSDDSLAHKITYQMSKIEAGVARELYNSSGDTLSGMLSNMLLVSALNDRIKSPFIEFVLSSPVGEDLTDEKFLEVAKEYLSAMGYANSCYTVIKNDDKDNRHVHVLATTSDMNGKWITDSFSRKRSGIIMRELEKKHGLEVLEKGRSSYNRTLGESQYRQYFFDTALHKALRSHNMKKRISEMLMGSETFRMIDPDMNKAYTNAEWRIMLGEKHYGDILEVLSNARFFNPLYKDELLAVMDRVYPGCNNMRDFRERLEKEGYYCRLVSDKGKSHYVYGIPERGFYLKDSALPERYRFGKIAFAGNRMSPDEQKHYLYNRIFVILQASSGYEDFKGRLTDNGIKLIEHVNGKGVYGLSFAMLNVDKPELFKGSDISRRLTYQGIQGYFQDRQQGTGSGKGHQERGQRRSLDIDPIVTCYVNNRQEWERDLSYMYPVAISMALDNDSGKRRKGDEDLPDNKKRKKRNKGLSY